MTLQKKRSKHCQALGIKIESRRFRPNLTLARLNRTSFADLARSLEALYLAQADPFWIDSFQLFSRKLHPNGAIYRLAHNFSQRGFTQ
jgi:2'-5' RNA ligase